MNRFISDCRLVLRMLRAPVRDEDDCLLSSWEKLIVAVQILCGMIDIVHERKG